MYMQRTYAITEICDKYKIPDSTVRHYEKEFADYFSPKKKIGKKRVFTEEDVRVFAEINRLRRQNRSLAEIKETFAAKATETAPDDLISEDLEKLSATFPKPDAPPAIIQATGPDVVTKEDIEALNSKMEHNIKLQENILDTMGKIGSICKELRGLLDLNLRRYNELSRALQDTSGKRN